MRIIFLLILFVNLFGAFTLPGQTTQFDEQRFKLGLEAGFGFNELIKGSVNIGELPSKNGGVYIGAIFKYIPRKSVLGFVSGMRYQRMGSNPCKADNLLVPLEMEFILFKRRPVNFLLNGGSAIEFNLFKDKSSFYDIQRIGLNWRFGAGVSFAPGKSDEFLIQCLRSVGSNTYTRKNSSPGGALYEVKYRNSGIEFGVKWIRRI